MSLAVLPVLFGVYVSLLWGVLIPAEKREVERQIRVDLETNSLVHVGDPSPSYSLTDLDGREVSSANQRGKVVLVNFFATWCEPCMEELPTLQEIWDEHGDKGNFTMVIVGREESQDAVTAFRLKHGYTFPMAADPAKAVYELFAKKTIPRTYLVSADGKICFSSAGNYAGDLTNLRRELSAQLTRRSPATACGTGAPLN